MTEILLCCPSPEMRISIDLDEKTYTVKPDGSKVLGITKRKFFGDKIDQIRESVLNQDHVGIYGIYHCKNCFNKVCVALGKRDKRIG